MQQSGFPKTEFGESFLYAMIPSERADMKKSELNLTILKKSFDTLKECYEDYTSQQDDKIKNYIKDSLV